VVYILDLITLGVAIAYAGFVFVPKVLPSSGQRKRFKGNGHAKHGGKENVTVHIPKVNGNLDSPGAGKKSLRKKKSRAALNGGSPNDSIGSNS
jgi:hypothetical protein